MHGGQARKETARGKLGPLHEEMDSVIEWIEDITVITDPALAGFFLSGIRGLK